MSQVRRNIVHNLWGQAGPLFANLYAVHVIFRSLGPDSLGVILFAATLNGVLASALELGISTTTIREIAAYWNYDSPYIHTLIRTFTSFYWTLYLVIAIAVWWWAPILVMDWIHLDTMSPDLAIRVLRVLGVSALLALPRALYSSLFRGLQRMELNNGLDTVATIVQQIGAVLFIYAGVKVYGVVLWFALTYVLWTMAYVAISAMLFPWSALVPGFSTTVIRKNARFSLHMGGVSILSIAHLQSDKLIVSKFLSVAQLGYYTVVSRVVARAASATAAVAQAGFPSLSALLRDDRPAAVGQYQRLHNFICIGTVPIFAAIVFATVPVLTFLFNSQIAISLLLPMTFLAIGQYMNGTLSMPYIFSLAAGKPEIAYQLNLIALVTSTPAAIWLVYQYGLLGGGFSWVVYHLVAYVYGLPRICRECIGISPLAWYTDIGAIAIVAAASYLGAWIIVVSVAGMHPIALGVGFVGGSIVYLAATDVILGSRLPRELLSTIRLQARRAIAKLFAAPLAQ